MRFLTCPSVRVCGARECARGDRPVSRAVQLALILIVGDYFCRAAWGTGTLLLTFANFQIGLTSLHAEAITVRF